MSILHCIFLLNYETLASFRLSQRRIWRLRSSGIWHHVTS